MLNKLKEMYYKYNAKHLEKYTYTKYKIIMTYKDKSIKEWTYNKYCLWDENDIIEWEVIDNKKSNFYINNGIATPVCDIESIQAIALDSIDLYFYDSISDWKYTWMSDKDIREQQEKWKNETKYVKDVK